MSETSKQQAESLIRSLCERGLSLVTAESCTGGLVAASLSEVPGAGKCLHGGFVTYTTEQKARVLGLDEVLMTREGTVNEDVARDMARHALDLSPADIAVSVTGVAGPDRDEFDTPVGRLFVAAARKGCGTLVSRYQFDGLDPDAFREAAVERAIELAREAMTLDASVPTTEQMDEALDHALKETFPASDPVSIVCR